MWHLGWTHLFVLHCTVCECLEDIGIWNQGINGDQEQNDLNVITRFSIAPQDSNSHTEAKKEFEHVGCWLHALWQGPPYQCFIKHPKECLWIALGCSKGWLALQHIAFEFREWGTWIGLGQQFKPCQLYQATHLSRLSLSKVLHWGYHSLGSLCWWDFLERVEKYWAGQAGQARRRHWRLFCKEPNYGKVPGNKLPESKLLHVKCCAMIRSRWLFTLQVNDQSASMRKWALGLP